MIKKSNFKFKDNGADGIMVDYTSVSGDHYKYNCVSDYDRNLAMLVKKQRKPPFLKMQELYTIAKYKGKTVAKYASDKKNNENGQGRKKVQVQAL